MVYYECALCKKKHEGTLHTPDTVAALWSQANEL